MEKSDRNRIALILFHVAALVFMIVTLSLLLEEMLLSENPNDYLESIALTTPKIMSIIAGFIGIISWMTMVASWVRNKKLDNYLKLILFLTTLVLALVILFV